MNPENRLGEKDRKILIELDKDARRPDSKIAKKTRLSKQVTNYRIKKLQDEGIISRFYTVVNVGKLGFSSYYVFLQLQNLNEQQEKTLMNKITNKSYVGWLVNGTGRWDAVALIYAKTVSEFDKHLNDLLKTCGDKLHETTFTQLISAEHLGYKFLGQKITTNASQSEKGTLTKLETVDKSILKSISQNARVSTVELSERLKLPVHVIRYRLKRLIKENIIESFKPKFDVGKLGYQWHLLLIQFSSVSEKRKKQFTEFCSNHKNIYYATSTIGNYNLMLDIHVKDTREFKKTLSELKEKYSDIIKLYESIIIFEECKIDYFTNLFAD